MTLSELDKRSLKPELIQFVCSVANRWTYLRSRITYVYASICGLEEALTLVGDITDPPFPVVRHLEGHRVAISGQRSGRTLVSIESPPVDAHIHIVLGIPGLRDACEPESVD